MRPTPIFDGHNDTLLRLLSSSDPVATFGDGDGGQLDLARARRGGLRGGLFACFVPSDVPPDAGFSLTADGYEVPMPDPPSQAHALLLTEAMLAGAHRLETERPGEVAICTTVAEIRRCLDADTLALVPHLEGAEAISEDGNGLEDLCRLGVRSVGPVWSRRNAFGCGVPFRYPGTPDIGPGLSAAGLSLVRKCNALGIMLDVSHLNAAGFWDVARTSRRPLVATHSNAHAVCPKPRNLTDDQLRAVRDSGGLVGVSLSVSELRPDGHNDADTSLAVVLRHMDHLLGFLGPTGVAIGSDLDGGAVFPAAIGDAAGLPALVEAMTEHGYDECLLRRICCENWLDVLDRSWR